jgi:HD-like signal output (HDOD) protein
LVGSAVGTTDELHLREREFLGYDHAVLGGHVLAKWGLPSPLPKVVAWQQGRRFGGGPSGLPARRRCDRHPGQQ